VKPLLVPLVPPVPLFPLVPPADAAGTATVLGLATSSGDDAQQAAAALAGALALYRRMRLGERLSADTFT
jgi:hypothetical protein